MIALVREVFLIISLLASGLQLFSYNVRSHIPPIMYQFVRCHLAVCFVQKQNVNPNVSFCRSMRLKLYSTRCHYQPWLVQKRLLLCTRWPRSVRGVVAHETTWFPPRSVRVSNYIQVNAIFNPG